MLAVHQYVHIRHACVGHNCVARQMTVLDGNECVDKMRAQRSIDILRLEAFTVGWCVHREVTDSLVDGSCRKAIRIETHDMDAHVEEASHSTII